MGIDGSAAVAGVVFGAGIDSFVLHAVHVGDSEVSHYLRIAAERALPVRRVVRIRTGIGYGRIIDVDVEVAEFAAHVAPHFVNEFLAPPAFQPSEESLARIGEVLCEAHGRTPLGVGGHQQRQLREPLQLVHPFHEGRDRPAHDDGTAHTVVADERVLPGHRLFRGLAADFHDE